MGLPFSATTQLDSVKDVLHEVAERLNLNVTMRLWNGELVPLGKNTDGKYVLAISGPGVIGRMLRRPTLETLVRLYATGHIAFEGGDLMEFADALQTQKSNRRRLKEISKLMLIKKTVPFLFARTKWLMDKYQYKQPYIYQSTIISKLLQYFVVFYLLRNFNKAKTK